MTKTEHQSNKADAPAEVRDGFPAYRFPVSGGSIEQAPAASAPETRTTLPAYRVIYADGESYITSMAKDVTLEMAKAYFVGEYFEQYDGSMKRVVDVKLFRQDTEAAQ